MPSIMEYSLTSKIPNKCLYRLRDEGLITDPLTKKDLVRLSFLEKIWLNHDLLRAQLNRFTVSRRQRLIDSADFDEKWERYAFARFHSQEPGTTLPIKQLVIEIEDYFRFTPDTNRLKQIRKRARYRRAKNKTAPAKNS